MGVRQPGVQGHKGNLDAKTDDEQRPRQRQSQATRRGSRCQRADLIHIQCAELAQDQRNTQEYQHRPYGALHEIFHPSFERSGTLPVKCHQQVGGNRHRFKPDPKVE